MAITINIIFQNKKIALPFKKTQKVHELLEEIIKRAAITSIPADQLQLLNDSSELFKEDTLEDLGINDNVELILKQITSAAAATTTTTPTDNNTSSITNIVNSTRRLSIGDITDSNNNNNNTEPFIPIKPTVSVFSEKIKQIDIIVLDVSGSMKAAAYAGSKVPGELEMTRIEVAQALFQTFIDKYVQQEIPACVGLVCFGERIDLTFQPTRNFDSFSTELGDVDANQAKTRLYEAIKLAAETIVSYKNKHPADILLSDDLNCRVFALTDGQDNSGSDPYKVFTYLKEHNIVLDAIPCGNGADKEALGTFTKATGGSCFIIDSSQAGVELFEREALINLSSRSDFKPFSIDIATREAFLGITPTTVTTVERKVESAVASSGKCVGGALKEETAAKAKSSSANKRIIAEYTNFQKEIENSTQPSFYIFMSESNIKIWKIIMKGPAGTAYDGLYMLSVVFPEDYPFKPPKVRFETKVFHCNISSDGMICLDILKDSFSPALTIHRIMLSICALLTDPNPMDPLDAVKAGLYRDNPTEYWNSARQWNKTHAGFTLAELKTLHSLE
ncbi:Ubiquitin-conjugating enzyme [Heterostelium album PN500]|uniref:Ubiquitin-conjugating enzyme n=1 Tax=Heterostelium pallidum (strain ATCC 26659 / Pp 5 / PN500) TaxID=670386 RepID=D3BPZ5_HETP5|nr:Ubiquitin-conjugating enzyme [Heterostelium album PN500]EFA76546.1 Ubiquitin-conjugating enzyme [Heterostelium album PN500]|eukprot:XP_020428678.1 Ubiquitin-conjugating enzyme [Heterostelium album PN500]